MRNICKVRHTFVIAGRESMNWTLRLTKHKVRALVRGLHAVMPRTTYRRKARRKNNDENYRGVLRHVGNGTWDRCSTSGAGAKPDGGRRSERCDRYDRNEHVSSVGSVESRGSGPAGGGGGKKSWGNWEGEGGG